MENRVELDKSMGDFLKNIRANLNETQQDAADKLGLSASFVGFIELGKRLPSVVVLKSYAEVYGVSYSELLKVRKDTIFLTKERLGDETPISILNE